jgi:predicted enzyme related to lactoylglutathione lyase
MSFVITLDVNNPKIMINFWSSILRYELDSSDQFEDPEQVYWYLVDPADKGTRLLIQQVPEPVTAKSRIHIDVHVDDIEAEAERAINMGAKRVDPTPMTEFGATWIRMLDPEGNHFCFVLNRKK